MANRCWEMFVGGRLGLLTVENNTPGVWVRALQIAVNFTVDVSTRESVWLPELTRGVDCHAIEDGFVADASHFDCDRREENREWFAAFDHQVRAGRRQDRMRGT
jgi:hypothetical protein